MSHHIDPDTRIHIEIDHIPCEVAPETTILSAAAGLGIQIPTLCYMKELAPDGSCRMCVVEVDGGRKKGLCRWGWPLRRLSHCCCLAITRRFPFSCTPGIGRPSCLSGWNFSACARRWA